MTGRRLRDDLRAYYESKEPSRAMLDRLVALEANARPRRYPRRWAAIAAVVVAVIGGGLWLTLDDHSSGALARAIASEIAMNHEKQLDADFVTASHAELRRVMDKLDFSLAESRRILAPGLRLVGARYCSIRGQLAAQLRFRSGDEEMLTVYQTALTDELARIGTAQVRADDVLVELWSEGDVFLGVARAP